VDGRGARPLAQVRLSHPYFTPTSPCSPLSFLGVGWAGISLCSGHEVESATLTVNPGRKAPTPPSRTAR
jgi:hypothetical protein